MTAIDTTTVQTLRARQSAGESLGKLAREIGVPWQRLWGVLRSAHPASAAPSGNILQRPASAGSLVERYRPLSLSALWGQDQVAKVLSAFAKSPHSAAFLFEGYTGTGKTSAALALAGELGCDLSQRPQEFGGVYSIASGEQSADAVRETARLMHNCPFSGSGWKVVIVNEADRMARAAETIWLDVLECLPRRTVVIFTTNESDRLSPRFLDRCTRLAFESDTAKVEASMRELLSAMWKSETGGTVPPAGMIDEVIRSGCQAGKLGYQDGKLSFRRAVQALSVRLAERSN